MKRKPLIATILCIVASMPGAARAQFPGGQPGGPYQGVPMMGPGGPMGGPMMGPGGPMGGPMMAQGGPMMGGGDGECGAPGGECGGGGCGGSCDTDAPWHGFGQALYITPRNISVPFGVIFNGPADLPPPGAVIQIAPPGVVQFEYNVGYQVGAERALDECNTIGVSYTYFRDGAFDNMSTNTNQIRSLVSQPSTFVSNAVSDSTSASANQTFKMQEGEVDFKWKFFDDKYTRLSLWTGARYLSLDQKFNAAFIGNEEDDVSTDVRFEGGGFRLGLELMETSKAGFSFYSRGSASFFAGSFRSSYVESNPFIGDEVTTGLKDARIVPVLDLEMGVSWTSPGQHLKLSAGYMVSGYFNMIKTTDLITAVQQNNFNDMSSTITLDGLTGSVEFRF